jgi:hypothetical protein
MKKNHILLVYYEDLEKERIDLSKLEQLGEAWSGEVMCIGPSRFTDARLFKKVARGVQNRGGDIGVITGFGETYGFLTYREFRYAIYKYNKP